MTYLELLKDERQWLYDRLSVVAKLIKAEQERTVVTQTRTQPATVAVDSLTTSAPALSIDSMRHGA